MSRLAGIFYFDSRPVSTAEEEQLGSGPVFRAPGLAMISPGACACAWDGRLDSGGEQPAAAALEQGPDGFRALIGDWSLALWDAARRAVVLASDYAGIRPLYYARTAEQLRWSSSLADLVRWTGAAALDETYAAGFLLRGSAPGRTPYRGIHPAANGEAIRIGGRGEERHRFWDLPCGAEIRLAGDKEYEERLLDLFREAVEVRLKPHARVCAELSGGLDSSSVVAMAARLGADVTTLSYTSAGGIDEKYFTAVEGHFGFPALRLPLDARSYAAADATGAAPAPWVQRLRSLVRQLEGTGITAVLTGQMGDFTMGDMVDDSDQVAGFLRRGEIRRSLGEAYAWSQALRSPIYPILWRALRMAVSSWTPAEAASTSSGDSITPALRGKLEPPNPSRELSWRAAPPELRRRFRTLAGALRSRSLETPEALQPLTYTHPYAHRPLVEFMLSIPPAVVCGPGETRRLMRRAFSGLLPESVLKRRSKGSYGDAFRAALAPMAGEMLRTPGDIRLIEMGLAESASLLSRLDGFIQGLESNDHQLRNLILFEYWLRRSGISGA
jgi:asparagine synthase (glutamine-hydrolysing)